MKRGKKKFRDNVSYQRANMTLQQEAHKRIDRMSDKGLRLILEIIDHLQAMAASDFDSQDDVNEQQATDDIVETIDITMPDKMSDKDKKSLFLKSYGNMKIDANAVRKLRERSMI